MIRNMKERTVSGIWKGPEQGEKVVDLTWPADWTQPWWGWGVREDGLPGDQEKMVREEAERGRQNKTKKDKRAGTKRVPDQNGRAIWE